MPREFAMTYKKDGRWVKMHKGRLYEVSCKTLGVERGKLAGRVAANKWWEAQFAIIHSTVNTEQKQQARQFLTAFLRLHPIGSQVTIENAEIAKTLVISELLDNAHETNVVDATDTLLGSGKYAELRQLADDVTNAVHTPVESSRLIGNQIDRWLQQQESRVKNGQLGVGSLRCYRSAMAVLEDEHGKQLVDAVTNDWIQDLFNALSNADLAVTSKCNRWAVWYMFFDHLDTLDLIKMPKLLSKLSFPRTADEKKVVWTADEYQAALAEAKGVKRLVLLTAANCSFYASDMAECFKHFDPKSGTISMARVKTKARQVVFHLWPETIAAMKAHGSELASLYGNELVAGKVKMKNRTGSWKFVKPLKNLRHTSQSFIHNSEFVQYKGYMCGLKEQGISETWYSHECQARIKAGFAYLRSCYGFR